MVVAAKEEAAQVEVAMGTVAAAREEGMQEVAATVEAAMGKAAVERATATVVAAQEAVAWVVAVTVRAGRVEAARDWAAEGGVVEGWAVAGTEVGSRAEARMVATPAVAAGVVGRPEAAVTGRAKAVGRVEGGAGVVVRAMVAKLAVATVAVAGG